MAKAILNDITIHYRTLGAGRDVVLIHGLGANQGFWNPSLLLPLARKYRVTLYDLRGHGYSGMPGSGYDSGAMAEDLHQLLDHLKIGRADVVGHSYGGSVALHTAVLFPEKVNSLILCETRVRAFQPTQCPKDWRNEKELMQKLEALGIEIPNDEPEAGLWLLERLASHPGRNALERLNKIVRYTPFGGWNGGRRSAERWMELLHSTTARQDFMSLAGLTTEKITGMSNPTLVICGEKAFTLPSLQGLKENLRHCQTAIVPGAGHFFPVTHPRAFVSEVSRFLDEVHRKDRRKHERAVVRMRVEVTIPRGGLFKATTANVSRWGLLLETTERLEIGSEIEMLVSPPEHPNMNLKGMVVRASEKSGFNLFRFGIRLEPCLGSEASWDRLLSARFFLKAL